MEIVRLKYAPQIRVVRFAFPQAPDRGLFVPKRFKEGIREPGRVKRVVSQGGDA